MENNKTERKEAVTVDLIHILHVFWQRAWIIALCAVVLAAAGFSFAKFMIEPQYSSTIQLYVNNEKQEEASDSVSSSDLQAAQLLVKTYGAILKNRSTLQLVSDKLDNQYSTGALSGMISTGAVNETEIMYVTVTCGDPQEAARILNAIIAVFPDRIEEIRDGTSVSVMDKEAPVNKSPVSPSISKYTMLGFVLGMIGAMGVLAVIAIFDNTIHDENYIMETYDYPILAKIPDLLEDGSSKRGYYKKSSYTQKSTPSDTANL